MFIKYKDDFNRVDSDPRYTVNQSAEEFKKDFINSYFVDYPNMQSPYKDMIQEAVNDVNSVTFN